MNMLSAKKVRLHGMKSSRWTTRDKLTQYKGLINLFKRDAKIISFDTAVARKKQVKELKQLRKDIRSNREDLDNAIQGDRQQLRNTLQEHKDLQLTFQNAHPLKVIDHLHQGNFNKRKLLDRMNYRMKQKTQALISLKLELAELEDRIKYEGTGQLPVEKAAQLITGRVQDAILKKEAALSVRHTYRNILTILKKDSLYFDAVLATLRLDGFNQSKCMVRTTELGQLATEYLDDRKQEFKELERAVKRDMKAREQSLRVVRQEAADLTVNMGLLIRHDSDINIGKVIIPSTQLDLSLQNDIDSIESILSFLKDTVYVSNFQSIFPCLLEQQRQTERLAKFLEKSTADRDSLAKKREHGRLMHTTLLYTMHGTTFEYKSEKAQLLEEIGNQKKRKKEAREVNVHQSELLVRIRSSLHQLSQKCSIVATVDSKKDKSKILIKDTDSRSLKKTPSQGSIIVPPPPFEEDGIKIIALLEPKLTTLMNNVTAALDADNTDAAYKFFQQLTTETCAAIKYDDYAADESLISDVLIEDASVPTYAEMKARSKELVEISTVNEDLIPMFTSKKKKFKF
ncbi:hypothetical protein ILUMI_26818 [Ignelater luminosus]|uniref:Uncharacterized protein n=1 Tax=Ignelater luminosus TaxID=2038154 RepID=A0A8K0C7C2_IGNLU|nr:hypothetical protein ILUMI_26818 [Ignelater luminosus]